MQEVFEKIIDQLKAESIIVDDEAGNRAVEIIEQAAIEYNNGWIPVEERLPERNKPVLVYAESRTISGGTITMVGACNNNGFWFIQNGVDTLGFLCRDYKVIAWQPLPDPYRPNVCSASDCSYNDGKECPAAEGCAGFEFQCANPASKELIDELRRKIRIIYP